MRSVGSGACARGYRASQQCYPQGRVFIGSQRQHRSSDFVSRSGLRGVQEPGYVRQPPREADRRGRRIPRQRAGSRPHRHQRTFAARAACRGSPVPGAADRADQMPPRVPRSHPGDLESVGSMPDRRRLSRRTYPLPRNHGHAGRQPSFRIRAGAPPKGRAGPRPGRRPVSGEGTGRHSDRRHEGGSTDEPISGQSRRGNTVSHLLLRGRPGR